MKVETLCWKFLIKIKKFYQVTFSCKIEISPKTDDNFEDRTTLVEFAKKNSYKSIEHFFVTSKIKVLKLWTKNLAYSESQTQIIVMTEPRRLITIIFHHCVKYCLIASIQWFNPSSLVSHTYR